MANPIESPTARVPFAPFPRHSGLAATAVVALWVSLCGAFAAEILPVGSAVDRLYELESARDRFIRAAHPRRRTSQSTTVTAIDTRMDVPSGR